MGDVSELYRKALKNRQRGQNTQDRIEFHNNARKHRRETEAFSRRNIDENMSPIITPEATPASDKNPNPSTKKDAKGNILGNGKPELRNPAAEVTVVASKRLEMLQKWKKEREKQKAAAKAKAKPPFKVTHLQHELMPNLENINKTIKGKAFSTTKLPQLAPKNHVFTAPRNLKPQNLVRGPKVDVLTLLKTHKFEPVVSGTVKSKPDGAKLVKNKVAKNMMEHKSCTKPVTTTTTRVTRSAAKTSVPAKIGVKAVKSTKKSPEKLAKKPKDLKIVFPKGKTAVSNSSKQHPTICPSDFDELRVVEFTSSDMCTGKQQDDTMSSPVSNKDPPSVVVFKPSEKSVSKSPSHIPIVSERKTPKKSVGFKVESTRSNSMPKSMQAPHTPRSKPSFRKTPLKKNTDLNIENWKSSTPFNNKKIKSSDSEGCVSSISSQSFHSASDDYPIISSKSERSIGEDNVFSMTEEGESVYTSPYVTISRGKQSARKEFDIRRSFGKQGKSPDQPGFSMFINKTTSPAAGASYFSKRLDSEIERIELLCNDWQKYLDGSEVPEKAQDSVDATIGMSKLLIGKKFQQFRGLIEECRSRAYTEKPITCEDLHGFWDMIYMQVKDLDKRFSELQALKENGWEEIVPEKVKPVKKRGKGRTKKVQTNSKLKGLIAAARQKKTTIAAPVTDEEKQFVGGYFEIRSPVAPKTITPNPRRSASTRLSVLTAEKNAKRCSSSPGLLMMKVSQSIKQGGGLTPARSILKTVPAKSTGKKSVLFKEEVISMKDCKAVLFSDTGSDEEIIESKLKNQSYKENVSNNMISFSPGQPRRSARISMSKK